VITSGTCTGTSNSIVITSTNNPVPAITYSTPLSFCSPGNVLLTANIFSGVVYQWQKNSVDIAGATSQSYAASSNGAYRVKETANGCYKFAPAVSVAKATSVTAAITANGPTTFCTGSSVVLSVTNAIPGYSLQWKNNNLNITGATLSSYTAASAGSYTCYITASCGSATSNTIAVTTTTGNVVANITPAGTVSVCNGTAVLLSANTDPSYLYQWNLNGVAISGATASTYSANLAASYTVTINSTCGNATSLPTFIANLTASITPTSTTTICAGSATTFSANTGTNFTYQWYRNGSALSAAINSTYSASSNGTYKVVITQGGTCTATSANVTLVVANNPTPAITAGGPTTICAWQSVTLTANTFAGVVYQWQKNSNNITGATAQSYLANAAGAYRVKETANGCYKYSPAISVIINCRMAGTTFESSGGNISEDFSIFPNPNNGEFVIEFNQQKKEIANIYLQDMLGKTVYSKVVVSNIGFNSFSILAKNIAPGIYNTVINTDEKVYRGRIVVE
jgi:hypothetical protein